MAKVTPQGKAAIKAPQKNGKGPSQVDEDEDDTSDEDEDAETDQSVDTDTDADDDADADADTESDADGDDDGDDELFPDASSRAEAEAMWKAGQTAAAKQNPVGTMQAKILEATLGASASSGRLQIHYELEVLSGKSKGEILHKYDGLGKEQQVAISMGQLKRLGINADRMPLDKIPAALVGLTDKIVMISAKQNGDFYNIYFQRLVKEAVGAVTGAPKKPGR